MEELELSIMSRGDDPVGDLRPLLDQFEAEHRCRIRVKPLLWESGWAELVKVALYGEGPHISEIGTTWCASLVAMDALRPFTPREVASFGGPSAFLPSSWQTGILPGDDQMWAVPWLADMRVLYYRRDLLEQAGVDEQTAFQSHQHLMQTLERLRASGVATPWVMATSQASLVGVHNLASWVWGAGGDFVAADGKRTLLNLPETRAGIRAYLELGQYLSPAARGLSIYQSAALFQQGQAAVALSWPLALLSLRQSAAPPVMANLGVALTPGVTWIGGSNLVVWRHISRFSSAREDLAVDLVRFLTGQSAQSAYNLHTSLLPVRPDVLDAPPFGTDPVYRVFAQGLKTGRSFPSLPVWGLVEDRLVLALAQLWEDVLARPGQDLDAILVEHLDPLAHRVDLMLAQRS
jgi:multiple sugar transport system substrate-binding protein